MIIKEIELYNFRIYKGIERINLKPKDNKNIIIISGKNGFGKTTFLMSIVWCLYGRQTEKVDDLYQKEISDKGGYTKYIANSLNRAAKAAGETKFSVSINLEGLNIPEVTCNEVKITRSYDIFDLKDEIEILIDGHPNELISELGNDKLSGEEIFIRDYILPLEIAKFFLFDAEKIVSLAEINSPEQRKQLSLAYSEVLGIKKYEELRISLERQQDEYRKQSANAKDKAKFVQLDSDIQQADIEIENINGDIELIKEEKDANKFESNQIQEKLIREGNLMTLEELEKFREKETILLKTQNQLQEQLKTTFDLVPFAVTGEKLLEISEQLELEQTYKLNKFQLENIEEKTHEILNELEKEREKSKLPFDSRIHEFYAKQIKELIIKHFYSDIQDLPDHFKTLHDFSDIEINEFNSLIENLKVSFRDSFISINSNYTQNRNELRNIQAKIREAEKHQESEYISDLRIKKDRLDRRNREIDGIIENLVEKRTSERNKIKLLETEKTKLKGKIDVSEKNKTKDEEIKKVISELKDFIKRFKEEKKKSLEEGILQNLDTLLHKKDFINKVAVDISISSDDIDINLFKKIGTDFEKLDKEALSKGEQQLYATSLLKALVDESEIEFPVFIDSPMQKFDDEHSRNIIENFYPQVADQVVIFPLLTKELNEEEYNKLLKYVSRSFIIHNNNPDSSDFVEVIPGKLFEEYNLKYNYVD